MSSDAVAGCHSHFVSFGLIVTGKAEEAFLPQFVSFCYGNRQMFVSCDSTY